MISLEQLKNKFSFLSMDALFSMATTLGLNLTPTIILEEGICFEDVKRGRGAYQQRIVIPNVKIDGELITGPTIHPKLARATALALLKFCEENGL